MRSLLIAALASLSLSGCGAPSTSDFVQKAAMSDMYEVEAGKLAAEKGQSDAVNNLGNRWSMLRPNHRRINGHRKN